MAFVARIPYVVNHCDQFAADLDRAAELMRGASTEELVDFVQDSHRTVVIVDSDELEAARWDEKVQTTLVRADELFERFEREGRDFQREGSGRNIRGSVDPGAGAAEFLKQMSHQDADIDIASLDLHGCGATQVFAEHEWGLLLRACTDGRVLGVEIWRASERLPEELLVALPAPAAEEIIVGRQRA